MKTPPHLPVDSCNIANHKMWIRLRVLLVIILFSMITAVAGASVVIGWLWPTLGGGEILISARQRPDIDSKELEDIVKKEVLNRVVFVYNKTNQLYGVKYLANENKIGDGVVVSSDGWVAMYSTTAISSTNLVVFADNKAYTVEKTVFDKYTNINYLKLKDSENKFKIVNFITEFKNSDDLFVYNNNSWEYVYLIGSDYSTQNLPKLDIAIDEFNYLNKNYSSGKIVINSTGRMVGFINEEGNLVSSLYLNRSLSSFLKSEEISYPSLAVSGWYSFQRPILVDNKNMEGFFVSSVVDNTSKLKSGDIITEINGVVVTKADLWYIINNNKEVNLKIFRAGKYITVKTPIIIIK